MALRDDFQNPVNPATGGYTYAGLPVKDDTRGLYFPDAVIDAYIPGAKAAMPQATATPDPPVTTKPITFEQSRELVLAAIKDFNPDLGRKAQQIFDAGYDDAVRESRERTAPRTDEEWATFAKLDNPARWRLEQVPPGQSRMQRSRPANGAENPNDFSIIDYQYDGTPGGVVVMAHEVGHSIADDWLRQNTKPGPDGQPVPCTDADNPVHMAETQAYFVQNVYYGYVMKHSTELEQKYPGITAATQQQYNDEMGRYVRRFPIALTAMDAQKAVGQNGEISTTTMDEWLGPGWQNDPEGKELADAVKTINADPHEVGQWDKQDAWDKLDALIERLHCRPAGMLSALGAYNQVKGDDQTARRQAVVDTMLGRRGPPRITAVLTAAGVDQDNIADFGNATVKAATQYMPGQSAAPDITPGMADGQRPALNL